MSRSTLLKRATIPGLVQVRGGFVGALPHALGQGDTSTSSLYLLMDWIDGVPLDRWARSVEVSEPEQLLLALVPVAAALDLLHSGAATHGIPVVHRDVKPANILIRPAGDTVLVDVGSARGLSDGPLRSGVVGTPGYIAPEGRTDGRFGPAADRYSLGAVAYALLTGSDPPIEATVGELKSLLMAAPILQGRPDLAGHVLRMLDPDPASRPECLANWVAQLRRSSLVALPGPVLAPRAPARHPAPYPPPVADVPRRRQGRRRLAARAGALVATALAAAGFTLLPAGPDRGSPQQGVADATLSAADPMVEQATSTFTVASTAVVADVATTVPAQTPTTRIATSPSTTASSNRCTNENGGYTVTVPQGWFTAPKSSDFGYCRYFDQTYITSAIANAPIDFALPPVRLARLTRVYDAYVSQGPPAGASYQVPVTIDGRRGVIVERTVIGGLLPAGTKVYEYFVDVGGGNTLNGYTDSDSGDYDRNRQALDQIMDSLRF